MRACCRSIPNCQLVFPCHRACRSCFLHCIFSSRCLSPCKAIVLASCALHCIFCSSRFILIIGHRDCRCCLLHSIFGTSLHLFKFMVSDQGLFAQKMTNGCSHTLLQAGLADRLASVQFWHHPPCPVPPGVLSGGGNILCDFANIPFVRALSRHACWSKYTAPWVLPLTQYAHTRHVVIQAGTERRKVVVDCQRVVPALTRSLKPWTGPDLAEASPCVCNVVNLLSSWRCQLCTRIVSYPRLSWRPRERERECVTLPATQADAGAAKTSLADPRRSSRICVPMSTTTTTKSARTLP